MSDEDDMDGGDISSGFGVPKRSGPVSDERAERMLHPHPAEEAPGEASFAVDEAGNVVSRPDDGDEEDASPERGQAGGGGGGGGW